MVVCGYGRMLAASRVPGDFGGDGVASEEGVAESVPDLAGSADMGEEVGLEEARDAESGGDENYA